MVCLYKRGESMSESRLFKILYYLLDRGRATAPELAEALEVSVRTIYRDVEALSGAGIPVYAEPGRNGGIYLLHGFVLDRALLSEEERREVLTAIQSVSAAGYAAGPSLLTKLSGLFHMKMGEWLEVDFSRWGKSASDSAKFETLKGAVIQHREIRIVYEGASGGRSRRVVQPLKLSYRSKEWYLKAFCLEKRDFRLFKLNRILELEQLAQNFVPRQYPEQEAEPGAPYPRIVLQFSREAACRVYDEFDDTQVARQEDGGFIASAEMPVDSWLVGYLLSFGAQVDIIEPADLRDVVAEEALAIYKKNKS